MPRALARQRAVDAGLRDLLITIEQLTDSSDDSNFPIEDWTTLPVIKAWAARDYITLDETTKVDQLSASIVTTWEIPYMASMDPDRIDVAKKRRIRYLDRTYDILSAQVLSRADGMAIILSTLAKVG